MVASDALDLAALRLAPGEGARLDLGVRVEPVRFGGERYEVVPDVVGVRVDVSRMSGGGYALRLAFSAALRGPCMRCLGPAEPLFEVQAREVDRPGGGEELDSPYVSKAGLLDLGGWARDALVLALPPQLLCRADCAGLCPVCGEDLNTAAPGHAHPSDPDPRWAKLSELKL